MKSNCLILIFPSICCQGRLGRPPYKLDGLLSSGYGLIYTWQDIKTIVTSVSAEPPGNNPVPPYVNFFQSCSQNQHLLCCHLQYIIGTVTEGDYGLVKIFLFHFNTQPHISKYHYYLCFKMHYMWLNFHNLNCIIGAPSCAPFFKLLEMCLSTSMSTVSNSNQQNCECSSRL